MAVGTPLRCLVVSIVKGQTIEVSQFADSITVQRPVTYGDLKVIPNLKSDSTRN